MEHRNLIAALCMISAFILPINAELKYVDASRLTLIGKVMPTPENVYHRVDTVKYNDMPFQVKRLFTHSAGLVVSFKTNSPTVAARWTTKGKGVMGNVTPICDRGLDLYMNDGGKWIPVGAGTPSAGKAFRHTVLMYGSSILHGACASRSGLAYPARMSRNTGINFVNYGLSGNGKMEAAVADMLKDIDADAFILDCMPNPSPKEITERTQYLVNTIRKYHQGTPIIMIETYMRENGYSDQAVHDRCTRQGEAFVKQYELLKKQGIKDLYLIRDNHAIGTDHEGSVDGTHPNDLGFDRMVEQYQPQIMRILKKYGIK